ncbi:MAG: DUF1385 domain-containing protein [Oscillospiraceae bacterium]|nr:DUF1385 domain-containing protein [Oscillospiraceae bacterium]
MPNNKKKQYAAVGGQALIEGVMMMGKAGAAISIRKPDGAISTRMKPFRRAKDKHKWMGLPFIRGIVNLVESQVFGYKCMMESAEAAAQDITEDEPEGKLDAWLDKHLGEKLMGAVGAIALVVGLALAFALFAWLPTWLFGTINAAASDGLSVWKALFEGLLRVIIFVAYMFAVSRTKDIHRVFMYHGAEHKTIFCLESGADLTVANVRRQGRFHPRCGTSFIFLTIALSIAVSALVLFFFPWLKDFNALWICTKILLLPLIIAVGYELIQLAGKHQNVFTHAMILPGLWMQRLTTAEPDDGMIEVAIKALQAAEGTLPPEELEAEPEPEPEELNLQVVPELKADD